MPQQRRRPGPRDLSRADMVTAAVDVMEERGEVGFSLRRVAVVVGCDPMAVSYHFSSKEGLVKAMAAWIDEQVADPDLSLAWRPRLDELAAQYRVLALRYPRTFPLLQRYVHSGPADYAHSEVVHRAFADAGVPEVWLPTVASGWYACLIGVAVGEVSGLVAPIDDEEAERMIALDADRFDLTRRLVPAYREVDPAVVFHLSLAAFLDGVEGWIASGCVPPSVA